jgi:sugar phosphate isomerase/epimerase
MKLGIFAKTFGGSTPAELFAAARNAGYETVQYNMACSGLGPLPLAISTEATDEIRAASQQTGITIAAVSATYNMIHPDLEVRENGRQAFRAIAAAAARLGTDLLTVCTGTYDPHDPWRHHPANTSPKAWNDLCTEFRILIPIAADYGIRIGVEPELANVVHSAQRARDLLDTFGNEHIRIVFDAANLFETVNSQEEQRAIVENAIHLLTDSIALAHAKDRRSDGSFTTAGTGILDYMHYLSTLRKSGFNGAIIAHGLSAAEAPTVAAFLKSRLT